MNTNKLKNIIMNNNFVNFLSSLGNFPDMTKPSLFSFTDQIFETSDKFNNIIVNKLQKKSEYIVDLRSIEDNDILYQKTSELLKEKKAELILGGLLKGKLFNYQLEFRAPVLIKKNIIKDFFSQDELYQEIKNLSDNSDYHIISHIKCQNIGLLVDGLEVDSNCKIEKYFNVIYQKLLSKMLNQNVEIGFILGKSYKSKKFNKLYCFDHLGVVYKNNDEIFSEIKESLIANKELEEALDRDEIKETKIFFEDLISKYYWYLSNLNQHGYTKSFFEIEDIDIPNYVINDLHKLNLLPNMNVDNIYDSNFIDFKKDFAEKIKEITLVPHCGPDERDFAFEKNIKKYSDIKNVISDLGFKKGLKRTIEVQGYFSKPNYLISEKNISILNKNQLSIYFDIELVNSMVLEDFKEFPKSCPQIITIIGLIVVFLDEVFEVKHFVINDLNQKEEAKNFRKFIKYIKKDIPKNFPNEDYTFYHYSSAEHSFFKKMFLKNNLIKNEDIDFYLDKIEPNSIDLLKIVKEDNICPENTFGKGLKPIAKGFYNTGKIPEKWQNSEIDGENSMVYTKKAYQTPEKKNHPYMLEVIKYNKIDCLTMFFIVFYWKYQECYFLDY